MKHILTTQIPTLQDKWGDAKKTLIGNEVEFIEDVYKWAKDNFYQIKTIVPFISPGYGANFVVTYTEPLEFLI